MREGREEEGKGRGVGGEREKKEEEGGNRGGRGEKRDARCKMRQENWLIDRPKVSRQTRETDVHTDIQCRKTKFKTIYRQFDSCSSRTYLSDKIDSPDEGDEVEHYQTARVIVLGGLHLGEVQPLHRTLEDTKCILSPTLSKILRLEHKENAQVHV